MSKPSGRNFTDPVLQPKNPIPADMKKEWRIRVSYCDETTDRWVPKIFKKGINYIHKFKERLAEANALKAALKIKLEDQGWNPLNDSYAPVKKPSELTVDQELEKLKLFNFGNALDFAYKKKLPDWSYKTGQDYSSVIKYLKLAAISISIHEKKISEFKVPHFMVILDEVKKLRKLSAKGFNKYREYLSSLVTVLVPWNVVELNFVHHVPTKQTIKVISHRPPTVDQRELIVGGIKNVSRPYYRFLCVEYGCTIRPKEICGLKIKDLHRKEQVFRIVPEKGESNSKVHFEREAVIPDWLMEILNEMNLHAFDPEWYIFSSRNKYGTFLPGPNRMHSNTSTNWWRKIIKATPENGGLGLDVDQYALKKLSENDMVKMQRMEGIDKLLEIPQMQMGHTTSKQTEDYVTEHLEVKREMIRKRMPVL